jgi:hypothetical protein
MPDFDLARTEAIYAYTVARISGLNKASSAQLAWCRSRDVLTHLRAPYWDEQLHHNTGCRRSYISPLGVVLGVGSMPFGHHSAKYPRTKRSLMELRLVRGTILDHLEEHYKQTLEAGNFNKINEGFNDI